MTAFILIILIIAVMSRCLLSKRNDKEEFYTGEAEANPEDNEGNI